MLFGFQAGSLGQDAEERDGLLRSLAECHLPGPVTPGGHRP